MNIVSLSNLVNNINKSLGDFKSTFAYKRKECAKLGKAPNRNMFFKYENEERDWAINEGGGTEIQYHIYMRDEIGYGLGFNAQYVPFANDKSPIDYIKPFVDAFVRLKNKQDKRIDNLEKKGFSIQRGNWDQLNNIQYDDYYLFGKTIKINDGTISDEEYNDMIDTIKKELFDLYIAIWEEKNKMEQFNKTIMEDIEKIKAYSNILQKNYNLILTGAPGTGKTYLAKQIAQQIISQKVNATPIDILKSAIDKFVPDEAEEKRYQNMLDEFYLKFPKEELKEMSLDKYCAGKGNMDSFCYWIEWKLKSLSKYSPGSARSYLIYWSEKEDKYSTHGFLKKYAETPEQLMQRLAADLSNMVNNNTPMEYEPKLGDAYIIKILSTYYPYEYAPILSDKHIKNIISLFNIECQSNNIFEQNKSIYKFYKEQTKDKKITPWSFMRILYDNFNIKEGESLHNGIIQGEGDVSFVQFHPSFDYTDFVEGLRPYNEDGKNEIGFIRRNGIFKDLCTTAQNNPNKKYVMIIDEINRGEISKIFGELFFSIDPGYRGEKGRVKTQYQNLIKEDDVFCDGFYVPENVYIIGTMNDIDRSVESMDFAFRRRFAFKEITAEETQSMLDNDDAWKIDGKSFKPDDATVTKIKNRMNNLNNKIWQEKNGEKDDEKCIEGLSSAYHIGASYFLKLVNYRKDDNSYDKESFEKLWNYHLEGLLREYLRGMQNVDEKIVLLKAAYDDESDTNN